MRLSRTKREVLVVSALIIFAIAVNSLYIDAMGEHEGIIRFHVIANSDSREDQRLKLKVRDGLLALMEKDIAERVLADAGRDEIEVIREYVLENQERIDSWAERIIRDEGYDYKVRSQLGVTFIPQKTYGGATFPAGKYEALNIVIGNGAGRNWWCVLFPPLCLIDSADGQYKEKLGITDQEAVVLKSKVAEMIKGMN